MQKMYNGEKGIQKYVCTLLAHFTEITLHTLLKYFKCNCLHCWCFHTIILFSFRSTFCHYAAFVNILRKHMYSFYSFHQNDHFRMMGHATKLTFCNKIFFFAEFKFVYKASLIICLHKYVNNSIYVFEPKFTKSRPMLSLKAKLY